MNPLPLHPHLFDTLHTTGVLSSGIGLGTALACHYGAPAGMETYLAAQLAEAWPALHAPGGAFHHPAVTRLHCLTFAEAVHDTCRIILLRATELHEQAMRPDLDAEWIARLDDPTARLAGTLCLAAAERFRLLSAMSPGDWTAETAAHCSRQQSAAQVCSLSALHLYDLSYRIAALWTADFEAALASDPLVTVTEAFSINFLNTFFECYLALLGLNLPSLQPAGSELEHKLQHLLAITPVPRSMQGRKPVARWASEHALKEIKWLHTKGLSLLDLPLPPLSNEDQGDMERRLYSHRGQSFDLLQVARKLPRDTRHGWQLLLGDRHLESPNWQTQSLTSDVESFVPENPYQGCASLLFIHWLADLFPTAGTINLLTAWLKTGNSTQKQCGALPLAVLCPTEATRQLLESLVKTNHSYSEYMAENWLGTIVFVWPDERTRSLLASMCQDPAVWPNLRETAVDCLGRVWPTEETRHILEAVACDFESCEHDEGGEPRSRAMRLLTKYWPDQRTRAILEKVIQNDTFGYPTDTAQELLKETWPLEPDRKTIESLLDGPKSANPYPAWDLLETLAAHWPDKRTKQRILRLITPTADSRMVEPALNLLSKHWRDPVSHAEITQAITDWLATEHNELDWLGWGAVRTLKSIMPAATLRGFLERNLDRTAYLLAEHFPDTRTRSLLEDHFIKGTNRPGPDLLAKLYPDEATRRFLIDFGLTSPNEQTVNLTLATLAAHWPDDTIRHQIESRILDPGMTSTGTLIEAYKAFAEHPAAKDFLIRAIQHAPSDSMRSTLINMIWNTYMVWDTSRGDFEWFHDALFALARGDYGELLASRSYALSSLASRWPDEAIRRLVEKLAGQPNIERTGGRWPLLLEQIAIQACATLASVWPDERSLTILRDIEKRGFPLYDSVKDWLNIATQTQTLAPLPPGPS